MNIVEIAAGSDDFNLLVRALDAANLVTTIQNLNDITVFAPTDAAFTALAQSLGFEGDATDEDAVFTSIVEALTTLGDGDPIPLLTDILTYHVSASVLTQDAVNASTSIPTLLADTNIAPADGKLGDVETDLPDPQIVIADIEADNGIIQAIDNVLIPFEVPMESDTTPLPPSITEIVASSGDGFDSNGADFDVLLAAVQAANLAGALDAEDANLTVFAPDDAAFLSTAQALGFSGSDEAGAFSYIVEALTLLSKDADPIPLLTSILTYHVSPGAKTSGTVLGSDGLATLFGVDLGVDGAMLVDADPDLPNPTITTVDITASNGIVHVLDGVLLPIDILPTNGANAVDFVIGDATDGTFDLGADDDFVSAGAGNDMIDGGTGNDVILGGDGMDTAMFSSAASAYAITIDATGTTLRDRTEANGSGQDFVKGVETLTFSDDTIDLATLEGAASISSDNLETLVELYVAYFDRAPDAFGLLFWANAFENGVTLNEVAELFFEQPETQSKLPASLSSGDFVDLAYNHVLERDSDAPGKEFWVTQLDNGDVSRAEFMLELIAGARANDSAADDVRTIEDKADIGVSYAVINGLTDADQADTVMDAYVRDNAESSLEAAQTLINGFAADAGSVTDGFATTVQLVGLVDDPFASDTVA